jgi:hypothetical protein
MNYQKVQDVFAARTLTVWKTLVVTKEVATQSDNADAFIEEQALTSSSAECSWRESKSLLRAHYLETHSFCWHAIHVLCSAQTLVLLLVLLQTKDKTCVNFHHHSTRKNILHVNNFFLSVSGEGWF